MTRREDWEIEVQDLMRREAWTLKGGSRPVKVLPGTDGDATALGGFFTLGIYLCAKTPDEIEKALGLPSRFLASGVRIYKFARLPQISEYDYELTAKYPDGMSYTGPGDAVDYPPGSEKIHQWRLKHKITIRVESNCLRLLPGQRFPCNWL